MLLNTQPKLHHINCVTHEGKVVVFGTEPGGAVRYTVRQDGFEDSALNQATQNSGWEDWKELPLPGLQESKQLSPVFVDQSVIDREDAELTYGTNAGKQYLQRSRYETHTDSAPVPVQLVSGLGHLYVFRQSARNSLLVDRYVLDGMTNNLVRKLEVRFKRSRQKYQPLETSGGSSVLSNVDSLDFRDANGGPFFEPTTELSVVGDLHNGLFSVILLPTGEHDKHRWHIFAYNRKTAHVELTSVRASSDGLFDFRDEWILEPATEAPSTTRSRLVPGIIRRSLKLQDTNANDLVGANGLTATRYDVQRARQTQAGEQLLRESTRVMLAVATADGGTVVLSFAVASDGTLAEVDDKPTGLDTPLRSDSRHILLPLNTLDDIKAVGDSTPPAQGTVFRIERGDDDKVLISSQQTSSLTTGDLVRIEGTTHYNGHYAVTKLDDQTFEIEAKWIANELGNWELLPAEETGLVFDGQITGLESGGERRLKVTAFNHGLESGDEVQIINTPEHDGTYLVRRIDESRFSIPVRWRSGEAANLRLQARKRRGIVLDGEHDVIKVPALDLSMPSEQQDFSWGKTYSAWVWISGQQDGHQVILSQGAAGSVQLAIDQGTAILSANLEGDGESKVLRVQDPLPAPAGRWVHYAGVVAYDSPKRSVRLVLYRDGEVVATTNPADAPATGEVPIVEDPITYDAGTIGLWLKFDSRSTAQTIFDASTANRDFFIDVRDGQLRFEIQDADGKVFDRAVLSAPDDQDWHRVAAVWRYGGRPAARLQLDGVHLAADSRRAGARPKLASPRVGNPESGRDTGGRFGGQVRELQIWKQAWPPRTIKREMGRELRGDEKNLAVYWRRPEDATGESVPKGNAVEPGAALRIAGWDRELQIGQAFAGRISDAQVWDKARTHREIKNSMYLQLTGRELALAGYWRMGAIARDGRQRKVLDFSIQGRDGIVQGDVYVGATTLLRTLGDRTTPAIRYVNEELFAVTQRASYVEIFEFRTDPALDPGDGAGNKLLELTYWGKKHRNAGDLVRFEAGATRFETLGDGWYRAACRFTVPDEINLVRSFEISNVSGSWETLSVRKHEIKQVSDTITEVRYSDEIVLGRLADRQATAIEDMAELDRLERKEARLLKEKWRIELKLAALASVEQTRQQVEAQRNRVSQLARQEQDLKSAYDNAKASPFNYWCYLKNGLNPENGYGADCYFHRDHPTNVVVTNKRDNLRQHWKFEPAGEGYYRLKNGMSPENGWGPECYLYRAHPTNVQVANFENNLREYWKPESLGSGYYRLNNGLNPSKGYGADSYLYRDHPTNVIVQQWRSNRRFFWKLEPTAKTANNNIATAQQLWAARLNLLNEARKILADLEALLNAGATEEASWEARLREILLQLEQIRGHLSALNTRLLQSIVSSQQNAQAMPVVSEDRRGLSVQGAVLEFVRPQSRVAATETAEGNVQLSYFDAAGRMRQTNYDATGGAGNPYFEQWVPDALTACIDFRHPQSMVTLETPVELVEEWTVEAWMYWPMPETDLWNTLTRGKEADHHLIIKERKELGTFVADAGGFTGCGYDMNHLGDGWHHIAAVGRGAEQNASTRFYIDGSPVGAAIAVKTSNDIYAIGNYQNGKQQSGRLAELRIWGVALSDDEVAINSKTLLSGNEPGLLAYFPLSEGTGARVRDHSGNNPGGTVQRADRWVRTALIGNPGHCVAHFDGQSDYLSLPAVAANTDVTHEFWFKTDDPECGLFSQANGAPGTGDHDLDLLLSAGEISGRVGQEVVNSSGEDLADDTWHHLAHTFGADVDGQRIYIDGQVVATGRAQTSSLGGSRHYRAGYSDDAEHKYLHGDLAEVRIWAGVRSEAETQAGMHRRHDGTEPGLLGYWPLSCINPSEATVEDHAGSGDGQTHQAVVIEDASLPVADSALVSAEYGTIGVDRENAQKKVAMMRRFFAAPTVDGVSVLTGKRVELLELKWIGNAQFEPTLLGYIEGAPPVPTENLTVKGDLDYNGASSVELTMSDDVAYTWRREQEAGLGFDFDLFAGLSVDVEAGLFITNKLLSTRSGFKGGLSTQYNWLNQSEVSATTGTSFIDKLELRGAPEREARFPHLGRRFIPKNVGYALVVSGLADVYITRLRRSRKMIGYQVIPNTDIPLDVNTITFLINPAYTMNGSLDGQTGSGATSERFFHHVPEMRSQYGSLYPASYYRLLEAYDLKQQIDQQDRNRQAYFTNFNSLLIDEASLGSEIGASASDYDVYGGVAVTRLRDAGDNGETEDQSDRAKLERIEEVLDDEADSLERAGEARQAEISEKISDQERRVHASSSFAHWQTRMEDLQVRAGKRNIVNTYVWDGDGGWRAEAQQFASTVEHTIGGSFTLDGKLGWEENLHIGVVAVELEPMLTVHLKQTMTKTESRSKGFSLDVDLSGVEHIGITDHDDHPLIPGEKVDRYRFMSFYLEGSTRNFTDFFDYVVDPEWLQSNDEEARALRQAMGKTNKAWRVLHRVTYVERPALMGLGQDARHLAGEDRPWWYPSVGGVLEVVEDLQDRHRELARKLDDIRKLLQEKKK